MEIRHKGPVMGQTVLYTNSGGTTMPAKVQSVNADGTVNLVTFPGGGVCPDALSVKYDPTLSVLPSWQWSDDL
jgi:hypothetical protein